jgi:hypothetical protein
MGWMADETEFESRYWQDFPLSHVVQTGYEVHPTSYPKGDWGSFPEDNVSGGCS